MHNTLAKMPILKVVLPFSIGIIISRIIHLPISLILITTILCACFYFFIAHKSSPYTKLSKSYLVNIPLTITIFFIGILYSYLKSPQEIDTENTTSAIGIIESIKHNDTSCNLHINVLQYTDTLGNTSKINSKISSWIENNDYTLSEGDIINFKFIPQLIKNNGNPDEFDYAGYMKNKGVIYHTFIRNNEYKVIGHKNNIFTYARIIQNRLIDYLLSSSLTPETKYFFITILLGEDSFLDLNTRNAFSHAGISHILALSGLHICIIAFLISFILLPLDYIGCKRIRHITTLLSIIAFAFVTGLSVSVIRATIMMTFVILAHLLYRKNTSMNALFASVLIILIINPYSIYDIGLQLSFLSVFIILAFAHKIAIISPQKQLLHFTYSIFSTSLIVSIGTIFLTAYYFNTISYVSIITNCIIIPLLPIIILIGIIYLSFLILGFDFTFLSNILNGLYKVIIDISHLGDYLYLETYISPLILTFTFLIFTLVVLYNIHPQKIIYIHSIIILIIGTITLKSIENNVNIIQSGVVIFQHNKSTPILTINNTKATLTVYNENFDIETFKHYHKKFLTKHNIDSISYRYHSTDIHTTLDNYKIAVICENSITKLSRTPQIKVDIVLVTKGFYGNIEDILRNYSPQIIIFSSNIYYKRVKQLIQECKALKQTFHSISSDGAVWSFNGKLNITPHVRQQ